jgi:hypothetical protein
MNFTPNRTLGKKLFVVPDCYFRITCLSGRRLWTCLVLGGFHPAGHSKQSNFCYFSKFCWRCATLEDHISGSTWPIWARVCLLEWSNSLVLIKNMKIGIYRLPSILGQWHCLMAYNSQRPSSSEVGLWGL